MFQASELDIVRAVRDPGLVILGFKPAASALAPQYVTGISRFCHPDEQQLRGSRVAFTALHKALMDLVGGWVGVPGCLVYVCCPPPIPAKCCLPCEHSSHVPAPTLHLAVQSRPAEEGGDCSACDARRQRADAGRAGGSGGGNRQRRRAGGFE